MYTSMTDSIPTVGENYDRLAGEYTRHVADELRHKPLDRSLLLRFAAELSGRGTICDIGCGPGHVARFLHEAGTEVFGMDISSAMLDQARKLNPMIPFHQGDMLALELPNGTLAGIVAFYAIVNIPEHSLIQVFREMERALEPGGRLLLAFHVGDEHIHVEELWGVTISMDFFLFEPERIQLYLEEAGFAIREVIVREPYPPDVEYQSRRAYIFARKPEGIITPVT
jgi:SAM-dependent methyltransferase